MKSKDINPEAKALAAVYHLLLQKAAERRARLAQEETLAKVNGETAIDAVETKNAPE